MAISDQDIQRVEAYLKEEMTEKERQAFEAELEQNEELRQFTQEQRVIMTALREEYMAKAKADLKSLEKSPKVRHMRWIMAAAAAVLLAAIIWGALQLTGSSNDPQQLYSQHFEPYPNYLAEFTRNEPQMDSLQQAMLFYENGKYKKAQVWLERVASGKKADKQFYLANALMADGKTEAAIPILEKLTRNPGFEYQLQAKWYLALAYLKSGQPEQAESLLKELKTTDSTYADRAADLLESL